MAAKQTEQYDIQVISQRYIRMALFEEYVNSKIDRFGENWSYSVARDNRIIFTALEPLSEEEISELQWRSQEARDDPFID